VSESIAREPVLRRRLRIPLQARGQSEASGVGWQRHVLVTKWLHQGGFTWPPIRDGWCYLSATQLTMLLDDSIGRGPRQSL